MAPKRGNKRAGAEKSGKYIKASLVYKLWTKAKMRSYADTTGSLLLTGGVKPKKHFVAGNVRKELSAENSELVNRPAMGLNLAASTIEGGVDVLKLLPKEGEPGGDAYASTCLPKLAAALGDVGDLASYLSVANKKCGDLEEHRKKCLSLLKHFGNEDDVESRMKTYAVVADVGARLYGLSMTAMELTSLAAAPKAWAKRLENLDRQPSGVRKFAKEPTLKVLAAAIAKENTGRVQKKDAAAKRFGASASEDSGPADDASSDERAESSSSEEKPKKAKKGGKMVARSPSPAASTSSSASAKKAKKRSGEKQKTAKGGKAAAEKKRKGFAPSDSDSVSGKAPPRKSAKKEKSPKEKGSERKEGAKDAAAAEVEAVEAKYLLWSVAGVQEFVSLVDTAQQGVGRDDGDGVFAVPEIMAAREKVPAAVLATEPALVARLTAMEELEVVPSKEARKVLRMLSALGTTVEIFFDGQAGANASASSAAPKV